MSDPVLIAALVGIFTLLVERGFAWANKIKKSKCCGNEIILNNSRESTPEKELKQVVIDKK